MVGAQVLQQVVISPSTNLETVFDWVLLIFSTPSLKSQTLETPRQNELVLERMQNLLQTTGKVRTEESVLSGNGRQGEGESTRSGSAGNSRLFCELTIVADGVDEERATNRLGSDEALERDNNVLVIFSEMNLRERVDRTLRRVGLAVAVDGQIAPCLLLGREARSGDAIAATRQ